jgi:opacity protein-like surface antigen
MRSLLWGAVFGMSVAVAAMPAGLAEELRVGELLPPSAADAANEAWRQAGVCVVKSPPASAALSLEEYPVDLCGGGTPETVADHDPCDGGDAICREDFSTGCCDGIDADRPSRRFYITGIIGASFGALQSGGVNTEGNFPNTGRATDSLLTAGGAAGMAFDRADGLLRLEVEGRGRDALQGQTNSFEPPTATYFYSVRATDGWSVMANAWRDWYLTDRLGLYGGGGIGAGGYRLTVNDTVVLGYGHMSGFAWQVGTGTTYQITDRTTIDLGYRFFDTVSDSLPLTLGSSGGLPAGSYLSNFYASELLLSVRIYEPFRSRFSR